MIKNESLQELENSKTQKSTKQAIPTQKLEKFKNG